MVTVVSWLLLLYIESEKSNRAVTLSGYSEPAPGYYWGVGDDCQGYP